MGAIVAAAASGAVAAGGHPDPTSFVTGYHHALEVATVIALTGAAIAFATLRHARHRPQTSEAQVPIEAA
jgi:hypothetical protein